MLGDRTCDQPSVVLRRPWLRLARRTDRANRQGATGAHLQPRNGRAARVARGAQLAHVFCASTTRGATARSSGSTRATSRTSCPCGRCRRAPAEGHQVAADRQRRHHVHHDAVQPGHRDRREDRRFALALPSHDARGHPHGPPDESRRRALRRQGLHRDVGRARRRARCEDGRRRLEQGRRELQQRLLHDDCAVGRARPHHGRRLGRRARHSRLRRRARREHRRAGLEDLHGAGARRARQRHLARRLVAHRRRAGLGHGQLRSEARAHVLGHGQSRAVDRRRAPRRQPLHELRRRARRRDGRVEGLSPVSLERLVGLGRGRGAAADRPAAQRPHGAGARARRPQRLSVDARAQRDRHLVHRR